MKRLLWIVLLLCFFQPVFAQNKSKSSFPTYTIALKNILLWSNGINFSSRFTPHLSIEATGSLVLAQGGEIGINYFFSEEIKKYNFYTGIHGGWMTMYFLSRSDYLGFMIPIGMEFYRKKWVLGVETGYMFLRESSYHQGDFAPYWFGNYHLPYYSAKIGLRFPWKK
jgi:hypothetical protein